MCDVFRPLQCYSSHSSKRGNIAKAPPPSEAAPPSPPPYRPRPGVVRMVPIKSIRLKYQRQSRPAAPAPQHHLYKYKAKFAMRNILQRSRTGRLNKIQSSNINNI